jgi:uncharacterized protein (DUF433 family)
MPTLSTSRITIEPGRRDGKPCVRGLRIMVWDVLGWLGAGMTQEQIFDEHPTSKKRIFRLSINSLLTPVSEPISFETACRS